MLAAQPQKMGSEPILLRTAAARVPPGPPRTPVVSLELGAAAQDEEVKPGDSASATGDVAGSSGGLQPWLLGRLVG